jgi:hypothetical protein
LPANNKQTGSKAASQAGKVLQDPKSTQPEQPLPALSLKLHHDENLAED